MSGWSGSNDCVEMADGERLRGVKLGLENAIGSFILAVGGNDLADEKTADVPQILRLVCQGAS